MYNVWTKHIKDEEEKKKFENTLLGSKEVLNVLRNLIDEKERGLDSTEASITAYDNPNWSFLQAHKNGYRSCLRNIKRLIDLDHQKQENNDRQFA